jgi:hypothetical protein
VCVCVCVCVVCMCVRDFHLIFSANLYANFSLSLNKTWTLFPLQRGRYQHIVQEVLRLASEGKLRVSNVDKFTLAKCVHALECVCKVDGGVCVTVKKVNI